MADSRPVIRTQQERQKMTPRTAAEPPPPPPPLSNGGGWLPGGRSGSDSYQLGTGTLHLPNLFYYFDELPDNHFLDFSISGWVGPLVDISVSPIVDLKVGFSTFRQTQIIQDLTGVSMFQVDARTRIPYAANGIYRSNAFDDMGSGRRAFDLKIENFSSADCYTVFDWSVRVVQPATDHPDNVKIVHKEQGGVN